MEIQVQELLSDFLRAASVTVDDTGLEIRLERLLDDAASSSAVLKRDMRHLLEKNPAGFLKSACRMLKVSSQRPGVVSMLDLLWSTPVLLSSLIDPSMLPLSSAIAFARRWVAFDPMLDIKLLAIGYPSGATFGDVAIDAAGSKRALEIVSELPPNRHILQPLARLLRSTDAYVRSKAALMYARGSDNPEWVRKMLADTDVGVRANAVEGLWGTKAASARSVFKEAALDRDHRVRVNGLLGSSFSGDREVDVQAALLGMAGMSNPTVRAAAAFAMGKIMDAVYVPILDGLIKDAEGQVRRQALQALISIRRNNRRDDTRSQPAELLTVPEVAAEPV